MTPKGSYSELLSRRLDGKISEYMVFMNQLAGRLFDNKPIYPCGVVLDPITDKDERTLGIVYTIPPVKEAENCYVVVHPNGVVAEVTRRPKGGGYVLYYKTSANWDSYEERETLVIDEDKDAPENAWNNLCSTIWIANSKESSCTVKLLLEGNIRTLVASNSEYGEKLLDDCSLTAQLINKE